MAKTLRFSLLFCFGLFAFRSIEASNPKTFFSSIQPVIDSCDAPAPDSFWITQRGGNFISLAWIPAWQGATHLLTVSEEGVPGVWNPVYIFPDVPGTSFTVNNLQGGRKYKFEIVTKCASGGFGGGQFTTGTTVIVELVIGGRTPVNPTTIPCTNIPYQQYEWVGFRVLGPGEGESSLFELEMNETPGEGKPDAYVHRLDEFNSLVAASLEADYPTSFKPVVKDVSSPFQILKVRLGQPPTKIGPVRLEINETIPKSINLCAFNTPLYSWKPGYFLEVLVANETYGLQTPEIERQVLSENKVDKLLYVQNPFSEELRLSFSDQARTTSSGVTLLLIDVNGIVVMSGQIMNVPSEIAFPVSHLPNGLYFLAVNTASTNQIIKVLKF